MSFFAATSRTSICPAASASGVRICVSMFTSFTSKGMYCSASHWMDSSSSSCVIRGSEIFLMMTEWPRTPIATSFAFTFCWAKSSWIAWTMAAEFMSAPSTIASGGSGAEPKASSW